VEVVETGAHKTVKCAVISSDMEDGGLAAK
jgi:hypothetical protein